MLGPFEWQAAEAYRSFFFSVERLADRIAAWTSGERILEVGAGEGRIAEALRSRFPRAEYLGVDIDPRVGRLFRGDRTGVSFRQATVAEVAGDRTQAFDLILICDVLHHIPWDQHDTVMQDIRSCLRPGGRLILKDWVRTATPIHLMNYLSDRVITGDRIRYGTPAYFRHLVERTFGPASVAVECRFPPWRNNFALFVDHGAVSPQKPG